MNGTKQLVSAFFIFSFIVSSAQTKLPILQSMKDELDRNMSELKDDQGTIPFFISYGITNISILEIDANLGSIYSAKIDSAKSWYSRVMIGDYVISDENYNDPGLLDNVEFSYAPLPLDYNNDGIRRALWKSTNNVFQTATKLYRSKKEFLSENNNPILPLTDLYETPQINVIDLSQNQLPDLEIRKKELADLSSIFLTMPDLWRSMISFDARKANHYFINSEGTAIVKPYDFARLKVLCQKLDAKGQFLNVEIKYLNDSTDVNLSPEIIKEDINKANLYMDEISNMDEFTDLYYGPVMIEGTMVSSFFLGQLMGSATSLLGYRPQIVRNNQTDLTSQLNELNRSIASESARIAKSDLQVVALPRMIQFDGVKTLGRVDIDAEGVLPPDTIRLVKDGKKMAEMAGRTPTLLSQNATGHSKLNFNHLGSYKQTTPSTLHISSSRPVAQSFVKKQLLEKAEQLGLDYALLFRTVPTHGISTSMFEAFKVYVADGKEEKIRVNNLNFGQRNELLKLAAISKEMQVTNMMNGADDTGAPFTLITPKTILIDGFEMNNTQEKKLRQYQMTIPSPLLDN